MKKEGRSPAILNSVAKYMTVKIRKINLINDNNMNLDVRATERFY